MGKPFRTSCKTNGFPVSLCQRKRAPRGFGVRTGARLLSPFQGVRIAAPFQHCVRAAFARRRASQIGIKFRSADGPSNARTVQVMSGIIISRSRRTHQSGARVPERWAERQRAAAAEMRALCALKR